MLIFACLFFSLQCLFYGHTNTVFSCEYPTKEPTVAIGGASPNHSPEQCVISYGKGGQEEADSRLVASSVSVSNNV